MAKIVQAVNIYGPKLELQPTAQLEDVAEFAAMRTGMNKSEAMMAFQETSEAILHFARQGKPVKLPGVGTFTPSIDRHGQISINFRADMALKNGMNAGDSYRGVIANQSRTGWSNEQYKELWDSERPEDPLEI